MRGTKPSTCATCPLYEKGQGWVPAFGSGSNGVLLVGEAPGAEEAHASEPFVGPAGFQLRKLLDRCRMEKADFRVHNVLSCRPPNNWLDGAPWGDAVVDCDTLRGDWAGRLARPGRGSDRTLPGSFAVTPSIAACVCLCLLN